MCLCVPPQTVWMQMYACPLLYVRPFFRTIIIHVLDYEMHFVDFNLSSDKSITLPRAPFWRCNWFPWLCCLLAVFASVLHESNSALRCLASIASFPFSRDPSHSLTHSRFASFLLSQQRQHPKRYITVMRDFIIVSLFFNNFNVELNSYRKTVFSSMHRSCTRKFTSFVAITNISHSKSLIIVIIIIIFANYKLRRRNAC